MIEGVDIGCSSGPDFSKLPDFDNPAVSRYSITTAHLWHAFDGYNLGRPESHRIRPFNFMLMYQPHPLADWRGWRLKHGIATQDMDGLPCVIVPYDNDLARAARHCFDRDTGKPVPVDMLLTVAQSLAQYHLRPEAKFLNADFRDSGLVHRRHVKISGVTYIGKEAHRWEEQSVLGIDPEAEILYGTAEQDRESQLAFVKHAVTRHGVSKVAREAGLSRQHIDAVVSGRAIPTGKTIDGLMRAATKLDLAAQAAAAETDRLIKWIKEIGVRRAAALACTNAGQLSRCVNGQRGMTTAMRERLRSTMKRIDRTEKRGDFPAQQGT